MANILNKINTAYNVARGIASDVKNKGLDNTIEKILDDPKKYAQSKNSLKATAKDIDELTGNKGDGKAFQKAVKKGVSTSDIPVTKNVIKDAAKGALGGVKGAMGVVGRNILPIATVGLEAFNTGKALADPYADWRTRTLDVASLGGLLGATYLGSRVGKPLLGAIAGELAGTGSRNMSTDMRAMNRGLATNSTPMTPEEQAIYDEYIKTGKTLNQQIGYNPASGDFIAPEQSNPQDFPYQTGSSAQSGNRPQTSSNLPVAPRIQDMNPNPEIVDLTGGQPPLQGNAVVNVDSQGNPVSMTGAAAPAQGGVSFVPYQPTVSYDMTEQEKQILQDAQNAANQVTSRDILDTLRANYDNMRQSVAAQDPRYQGGLIPAQGYYIDPNEYETRRAQDDFARYYGKGYTGSAQDYLNDRRIMYEIQMANQAGVPYEDYKAAMLDRQTREIAIRQKEVEDVLTLQAQQTSDMKERLSLLSDIYKSRIEAQREIDKANAAAFGDVQKQYLSNIGSANVANINQLGNLQQQQLSNMGAANVADINANAAMDRLEKQLQDPTTRAKAISQIYSSFGYLDPQLVKAVLPNLPAEIQELLYGGKLTPVQVNQLLGLDSMDMNNENSQFNRFMAKIRGVQANEQ